MPIYNALQESGGKREKEKWKEFFKSRLKISTSLIIPIICVNDEVNYWKLLHKRPSALISLDIILVKFISVLEMIPLAIIYLNV